MHVPTFLANILQILWVFAYKIIAHMFFVVGFFSYIFCSNQFNQPYVQSKILITVIVENFCDILVQYITC